MYKIRLFIFLPFFTLILANEPYLWPTNASTTVTALFGEERPHRYHGGIDIRTWGKIGYKLFATSDGYITRIRTGSKGYGKALYIQLSDGNTAVYAHLEKFTPTLNTTARSLQQYYNSYTIDHAFDPNEFPVRKGDLIGYSGDTGGISGAHLHFELRDEFEKPLNPLKFYSIKDNMPPLANQLAIIPLSDTTTIDGAPYYKIFSIHSINPFEYYLSDTIGVNGHFGLALDVVDRIDDQPFKFGVYKIILKVDGEIEYAISYDTYRFEDAKYIYTERDYSLKRDTNTPYYRLFNNHSNENLLFTDKLNTDGQEFFDNAFHSIEIQVEDYYKNVISIKGVILHREIHPPEIQFSTLNNSFSLDSETPIQSIAFIKTGRYDEDLRFNTTLIPADSSSFYYPHWEKPFMVLEIQPTFEYGIQTYPTFIPTQSYHIQSIEGTTQIKHFENGVMIQFVEDVFTGLNPILSFTKNNHQIRYPLYRISKTTLSSTPISFNNLIGLNSFEIRYDNPVNYSIRKEISSQIINPGEPFSLSMNAGEFNITGNGDVFHDTTFMWIEKIYAPSPPNGKIISGPYKVGPILIPMKKKIDINFSIFDANLMKSSGVFYYDGNKEEWIYLETKINEKKSELSTRILSGEIFAVIQEFTPPEITDLFPGVGGTYRQQDMTHLAFIVNDDFSGIDGEKNVEIKIDDGKPLIFEYNIYQKKVYYPFDDQLSKGLHTLYIIGKDNVGNEKIIRGTFNIK